jgi:hypothetical protein
MLQHVNFLKKEIIYYLHRSRSKDSKSVFET